MAASISILAKFFNSVRRLSRLLSFDEELDEEPNSAAEAELDDLDIFDEVRVNFFVLSFRGVSTGSVISVGVISSGNGGDGGGISVSTNKSMKKKKKDVVMKDANQLQKREMLVLRNAF